MPEDTLTDSQVLDDESKQVVEEELDEKAIEIPEEPEEEDEEKEVKEEKEEKGDEKFPFETPSFSEIKAEYPDFFKKFPQFRDVVFQQTEYRKLFATIDDAKEAIEDNLAFTGLRESVLSGKAEDLIEAVAAADKGAAVKLAENFLPDLYKKDSALYVAAVTPLFENLVRKLGAASDENTRNSAFVLAHFLWGKDGEAIVKGEKTFAKSKEESEESKRVKADREEFERSKFTEFQSGTIGEMRTGMAKMISRGLDPDGSMTDRAKAMLINDIISQVDKALVADQTHMSVMNSRWLRARKDGLNTASKEKLVSAYLSRAKQVIPSIRDKVRNDFLGVKKVASEKKVEEITRKSSPTKEVTTGKASNGNTSKEVLKPGRDLYRKMSDIDILNN